jgi:hypothetical protein
MELLLIHFTPFACCAERKRLGLQYRPCRHETDIIVIYPTRLPKIFAPLFLYTMGQLFSCVKKTPEIQTDVKGNRCPSDCCFDDNCSCICCLINLTPKASLPLPLPPNVKS